MESNDHNRATRPGAPVPPHPGTNRGPPAESRGSTLLCTLGCKAQLPL